jgi:hypothetical protein
MTGLFRLPDVGVATSTHPIISRTNGKKTGCSKGAPLPKATRQCRLIAAVIGFKVAASVECHWYYAVQ